MAKKAPPAPEWPSAFTYVEYRCQYPLLLQWTVTPDRGSTWAMVSLELRYYFRDDTYYVVRRWGERVNAARDGQVAGAAFRAAVQAETWLDQKTDEDLLAWARWHMSQR